MMQNWKTHIRTKLFRSYKNFLKYIQKVFSEHSCVTPRDNLCMPFIKKEKVVKKEKNSTESACALNEDRDTACYISISILEINHLILFF